ncbi:SDR family NAD(P)-dependent oxidoreductase [Hyalangium rubrum]|uniref:SDR family NAD(P)-dependent oxidoreductase n=1 Tax=Hyalangium rubrum TaxID=3103134 RepID=A0ABU5HDV3_9BACT|nr:SDR family NAD(P)-dependent oxidoreductase [Hyalangium sp. s54d21]MDY7230983.1 SDR family NAD(P)-dependent oxidoreductase [Hyalangium sp. s54d21]
MPTPIDFGTVLITGACSGVGREVARQLAHRVRTLVLVASEVRQLEALREALEGDYPTLGVLLLPCDLSQPDQVDGVLEELARHLIHVDVLVNAVAAGQRGPYAEQRWADIDRMLQTNVVVPLMLTHRLLGPMLARGRGGILHLGSGVGRLFLPGFVTPAATHRFLDGFLESLRLEVEGSGVVITQAVVGPLEEAESSPEPQPFFQISAARCVREAVAGFDHGAQLVYPGWGHRWAMTLLPLLPRPVRRALGRWAARGPGVPAGAAQPELPASAGALLRGAPVRT